MILTKGYIEAFVLKTVNLQAAFDYELGALLSAVIAGFILHSA